MNWIVYHAVTTNHEPRDEQGQYISLTHGVKKLKKLSQTVQAIVWDEELYVQAVSAGVAPISGVFHVVLSTQKLLNTWGDNVWITDIALKQVRRELKIQGFEQVLCLTNAYTTGQLIKAKFIQYLTLDVIQSLHSGEQVVVENLDKVSQKWTLLSQKLSKDVLTLSYQL